MTRWMTLTTAVLIVVPLFAQKPTAQPAPKPWANKLFLPDIRQNPAQESPLTIDHDFGTVPFGSVVSHTFTLTNIYDVPMQVIDVRTECGCLKAFPPNRVLQPNEQAEFAVTMNAGAFKGANTKKLLVTVGPRYYSTAELRLTATSREDVSVSPGQIDFGIVPQGGRPTKEVVLKYTGKEPKWEVGGPAVSGSAFDVEVKETARGFLGTDYTVKATLKETAPAGSLAETITLKTNDPATPVVTVGVTAAVLPPVSVAPSKVEFRGVAPGKAETVKVIVRAKTACTLSPVPDAGDGISVETFPASREIHIVTVTYTPKAAGAVRKEVRLKTSLPGNPEAVLVVEAKN